MSRFVRLSADDRRRHLIEAALSCMAGAGLSGFTVDKVCAKAGVSRGLITHHFGSMAGLLAAVYAHLYGEDVPQSLTEGGLAPILDSIFAPEHFNRDRINIWLTLWGAIANSPELTAEHRNRYAAYWDLMTAALSHDGARDPRALALALIGLIDGVSLQHCIDPASMPPDLARAACERLIAPHLAGA